MGFLLSKARLNGQFLLTRLSTPRGPLQTASVVDLVDEPWKVPGDVVEGFVGHRIDGFDLERLDEALGLGVVVGIAAAPHRTDKTAAKQGSPIGLSGVLRTADALLFVKRQFGWR